jgi:hypothetical protein
LEVTLLFDYVLFASSKDIIFFPQNNLYLETRLTTSRKGKMREIIIKTSFLGFFLAMQARPALNSLSSFLSLLSAGITGGHHSTQPTIFIESLMHTTVLRALLAFIQVILTTAS